MEEWLKRRVEVVVDAALLYLAVELAFPVLVAVLAFIVSSQWAMIAVLQVIGLLIALAGLATGNVPTYRSKMPGPSSAMYMYLARPTFVPPRDGSGRPDDGA